MSTTLTPTSPLFAVTRKRSRAYLNWARRLSLAEALMLLLGSCSLADAAASDPSRKPFAIGAALMAIAYLILGLFVGRGSRRAAVTLLGLSIARQIVSFMPGAAALANVIAPLLLADIFLYVQAARAAAVLAEPLENPLDEPVAPSPTVVADAPPPAHRRMWEPNFRNDFTVASVLVAVAIFFFYKGATIPDYHSGFEGIGAIYYWVIALYHLVLATILFAAIYGARKGKSWANRARGTAYVILLLEVLGLIRLALRGI